MGENCEQSENAFGGRTLPKMWGFDSQEWWLQSYGLCKVQTWILLDMLERLFQLPTQSFLNKVNKVWNNSFHQMRPCWTCPMSAIAQNSYAYFWQLVQSIDFHIFHNKKRHLLQYSHDFHKRNTILGSYQSKNLACKSYVLRTCLNSSDFTSNAVVDHWKLDSNRSLWDFCCTKYHFDGNRLFCHVYRWHSLNHLLFHTTIRFRDYTQSHHHVVCLLPIHKHIAIKRSISHEITRHIEYQNSV